MSPGKAVLRARSERVLGVRAAGCWMACLELRVFGGMACFFAGAQQSHRRAPTAKVKEEASKATSSHLRVGLPVCPQDLNPLPFTTMTANCVGWVAYAYVTQDVLVYWPNVLGFLLGMFYTISCYGLAGAAGGWLQCGARPSTRASLKCMGAARPRVHSSTPLLPPWVRRLAPPCPLHVCARPTHCTSRTACAAAPAADTKTRDRQLAIVLFFSTVLMVVGAVGTMGSMSEDGLKTLWGFTSNGEGRAVVLNCRCLQGVLVFPPPHGQCCSGVEASGARRINMSASRVARQQQGDGAAAGGATTQLAASRQRDPALPSTAPPTPSRSHPAALLLLAAVHHPAGAAHPQLVLPAAAAQRDERRQRWAGAVWAGCGRGWPATPVAGRDLCHTGPRSSEGSLHPPRETAALCLSLARLRHRSPWRHALQAASGWCTASPSATCSLRCQTAWARCWAWCIAPSSACSPGDMPSEGGAQGPGCGMGWAGVSRSWLAPPHTAKHLRSTSQCTKILLRSSAASNPAPISPPPAPALPPLACPSRRSPTCSDSGTNTSRRELIAARTDSDLAAPKPAAPAAGPPISNGAAPSVEAPV